MRTAFVLREILKRWRNPPRFDSVDNLGGAFGAGGGSMETLLYRPTNTPLVTALSKAEKWSSPIRLVSKRMTS
jgi:hypothetical protein